jgi:spore maturation protein B
MLKIISIGIIPAMVLIILIHGYVKGVDIYSTFIDGAKEGMKTTFRIIPYLIAIFVAVGIFRGSNAMEMLVDLLNPFTSLLGIPSEILPLVILRPVSGSGALGIVKDLIEHYGVDSFPAVIGCVMIGSSETIFYTITLYFGSIGVKDYKHTLKAALLSYIVSVFIILFVVGMWY